MKPKAVMEDCCKNGTLQYIWTSVIVSEILPAMDKLKGFHV